MNNARNLIWTAPFIQEMQSTLLYMKNNELSRKNMEINELYLSLYVIYCICKKNAVFVLSFDTISLFF